MLKVAVNKNPELHMAAMFFFPDQDKIRNPCIEPLEYQLYHTTSSRTSPVTEVEKIVCNLNCSRTFYPEISTLEYYVIFETIVSSH